MTQIAASQGAGVSNFQTVHLFAFGGFLKTCKWLSAVQNGRFKMNGAGDDFKVSL